MEQQCAASLRERQIAEFIENDQVDLHEPVGDLARLAVSFLVFQRVDELDSGEEPDSEVMVSDGLHADGGGEMGLAGARSADHHDVVGVGDEVTSMQGVEQRLIGGAFIEMEAAEVAIGWEAGGPHLVVDGADLALSALGLDQGVEHGFDG